MFFLENIIVSNLVRFQMLRGRGTGEKNKCRSCAASPEPSTRPCVRVRVRSPHPAAWKAVWLAGCWWTVEVAGAPRNEEMDPRSSSAPSRTGGLVCPALPCCLLACSVHCSLRCRFRLPECSNGLGCQLVIHDVSD